MERGAAWGRPATEPARHTVDGSDADLAGFDAGGALVRFAPAAGSDFARTLGITEQPIGMETAVDVMVVDAVGAYAGHAVNAVCVGTAPHATRWFTPSRSMQVAVDGRTVFDGRATGVVVASGQYLHAGDVNPRSHPGDGAVEVLVFAVRRGERSAMRRRLPLGTHVPHPLITIRSGRSVAVTAANGSALAVDGVARGTARSVTVDVRPAALRLLL